MGTKIITAFYQSAGTPQTAVNPTISIYTLDSATPVTVTTGAAMVSMGGGWYSYYFTTWDWAERYAIVCDGSATITAADDRYLAGIITSKSEDGDTFELRHVS